eukprot:NODE_53_length_30760_cov_1.203712.p8 type:complete len:391 gc:universal NODE_53_length_30760_cov_1.203712:26137-24965(-)
MYYEDLNDSEFITRKSRKSKKPKSFLIKIKSSFRLMNILIVIVFILFYISINYRNNYEGRSGLFPESNNKVALIFPVGKDLPKYSEAFFKTFNNTNFDAIFISLDNRSLFNESYSNIIQLKLNVDFENLMAEKLCSVYNCNDEENSLITAILRKRLLEPIRLCEFRPFFSFAFEDYLRDYKYVGWADFDTVWSSSRMLDNFLDFNYDVITLSGIDSDSLYLRGQFTIFKNSFDVVTSFRYAIPKDYFIAMYQSDTFYAEEGLYSLFMFNSRYSVLMLPFQSADWFCDKISLSENLLKCADYYSENKLPIIDLNAKNRIETRALSLENGKNCTTWVHTEYRTCLDNFNFGYAIIQNKVAVIYPLNEIEKNATMANPIFYHFQYSKKTFKLL